MLDDIRHLPTTFGCTLGDIIGSTPKELISSVVLEEKFFETWHTKRVVLLGDGKHISIFLFAVLALMSV